jgi:pyridinium-3,5-bisthiocarboxylic acid mononucleotide nickel chelatase
MGDRKRILYIDAIGGLAGDMLLAALLDAGASTAAVETTINTVLPHIRNVNVETTSRGSIRALRLLDVTANPDVPSSRSYAEMLRILTTSDLKHSVKTRAISVLTRLGEAEAKVHGRKPAEVTLHELGSDDTLVDIVGVIAALEDLGVEDVFVSAMPVALGAIRSAGHTLPLPAPAAVDLLKGFVLRGEKGTAELITPTGAALASTLAQYVATFPDMQLLTTGYGAGERDSTRLPNVVRVFLGTTESPDGTSPDEPSIHDVTCLEANLDDLSPELVADAADALRMAGALDVWTTPIQMKKGRSGVVLAALCRSNQVAELASVFFKNTSTLGIRISDQRRIELHRQTVSVRLEDHDVLIKVGTYRGTITSIKLEHDTVAKIAAELRQPVRKIHSRLTALAHVALQNGVGYDLAQDRISEANRLATDPSH